MKNIDKLDNIVFTARDLDRRSSEVRWLGAPESEKYTFCFHCHYAYPKWSCWPKGQKSDGRKSCEIDLVDGKLIITFENNGFSEVERAEIKEELRYFLYEQED